MSYGRWGRGGIGGSATKRIRVSNQSDRSDNSSRCTKEPTMAEGFKEIPRIPVTSDRLSRRATRDLSHIPGPHGHRLWGNSKEFLPNPGSYIRVLRRRYGNCFTVGLLGNRRHVVLTGPVANRLLLLDPEQSFSSRWGWEIVHAYFPGMVLLRDFGRSPTASTHHGAAVQTGRAAGLPRATAADSPQLGRRDGSARWTSIVSRNV